ncbi:hypothetical protein ACQ4PT_058387 [Festuca glaucescens]
MVRTTYSSPGFLSRLPPSLWPLDAFLTVGGCAVRALVYADEKAVIKAAVDGNLGRLKGIVKGLTKGNGDLSAIFSFSVDGANALHIAAYKGHLEPNIIISGAGAPLLSAVIYRSLKCVKLLLKEKRHLERRTALFKSQADTAFRQKEYKMASQFYDLAIAHGESATLYANRSLCKLLMADGDGALSDALKCRMLRPKWAKACFRQAAAHMLLKEYKQACDALEDAQKMEPGNAEIEIELRKARELMKNTPGDDGEQ